MGIAYAFGTIFLLLAFGFGCDTSSREVLRRNEAAGENPMAPEPMAPGSTPGADQQDPAQAPKGSQPLPAVDDGPITLPATITGTARQGSADDDRTPPKAGGGLILMGGGADVDSAFVWAHDVIAGDKTTRRGDVLVLRATGADGYDAYIYGLAPFHSVQTLIIGPTASKEHLDTAARLINRAEFVFFAGGNQADYVAWRNSNLMSAVQGVFMRGGVVGGTSAGLAILGQYVFDSISAGASNVMTPDAVANPFANTISFTRNMLSFPMMKNVLTDSHFAQRDRFGRLTAFMARQFADGAVPATGRLTGLGVDEATAILVDSTGKGIRAPGSTGSAFLIRGAMANRLAANQTLLYNDLSVIRLDADGQYYDFTKVCGTGPSYTVTVDGSTNGIYNPIGLYTLAGTPGTCPP